MFFSLEGSLQAKRFHRVIIVASATAYTEDYIIVAWKFFGVQIRKGFDQNALSVKQVWM